MTTCSLWLSLRIVFWKSERRSLLKKKISTSTRAWRFAAQTGAFSAPAWTLQVSEENLTSIAIYLRLWRASAKEIRTSKKFKVSSRSLQIKTSYASRSLRKVLSCSKHSQKKILSWGFRTYSLSAARRSIIETSPSRLLTKQSLSTLKNLLTFSSTILLDSRPPP